MSPTVGMFIMPEDYLKFISDLPYYFKQELVFISPEKSKWCEKLKHKDNLGKYLIGKLDDIELHMLHYHDKDIAKTKWKSRIKRVNFNRIIYKFNDQNFCQKEHIEKFLSLPLQNKLCFVAAKEMKVNEDVIFISQPIRYND